MCIRDRDVYKRQIESWGTHFRVDRAFSSLSIAEQENTSRLLFARSFVGADRAIEELIGVKVDLEECRTGQNLPGLSLIHI